MKVKKTGKIILGGELSSDERKALNIEIQKQLAELDRNNSDEIDAMILWVLHEQFGFGPKRLRQFYEAFNPCMDDLMDRYELTDKGDDIWLATYKLKDCLGIDIREWNNERREKIS